MRFWAPLLLALAAANATDATIPEPNATNATAVVARDDDLVTVACVTWNMAALSPSAKDCKFLQDLRHHSVVCVGVQELEDLKPRRSEGHRSAAWTRALRKAFPDKQFDRVADHAAGPVRLAVFVNRRAPLAVRSCAVGDVACGIGNIVRNKGCAPARGLGRRRRRIESPEPSGRSPLVDAADLVVFSGDLNYRLDLPREEAERGALVGGLDALLEHDQLRSAAGRAFGGFLEGPVAFAPTFKFDKRSNRYDSSKKMRVPSWTDRVLYTRAPAATRGRRPELTLASYGAVDAATHSDHRPVVATFRLSPGAKRRHRRAPREPPPRSS
ncbi:hypothetical protein JL721_5082 [Aureococcus anophagefferens]|nr:hypothetical protein JL721_5082 [Aureococcus anophagefferens]